MAAAAAIYFIKVRSMLAVSSTKIKRIWITTIDLIGTASNLRGAADIIGTYTAADAEAAIVSTQR